MSYNIIYTVSMLASSSPWGLYYARYGNQTYNQFDTSHQKNMCS